jgi:cobalt-zinc-cadmium efflux system protein
MREAHASMHHEGPHAHAAPGSSRRSLQLALVITASVMLLEVAGGWWTGSVALLADAGHMLTDTGALVVALVASWVATRPRSPQMSFGWGRAEILGALINGTLLGAVSALIAVESLRRLQNPSAIDALPMLAIAVVGLAANALTAALLSRAARHDLNARGALLHVLGDALGSLGAIAAGMCIWLWDWTRADAVAGLAVAALVVASAARLIRESVDVLLERVPRHLDLAKIAAEVRGIPGVRSIHDLHIWLVSSGFPAMSAHLDIEPEVDPEKVRRAVHKLLHQHYSISHTTIQTERAPLLAIDPPPRRDAL